MGIEQAVAFAEAIAKDNSHGYDQAHRLGPDYDCSSLVAAALRAGGYNTVSASMTTRNEYNFLFNIGFRCVNDKPQRGDIFLTPGKHTAMAVSESQLVEASINEKGTITGGKTGDQTGKEIWIHKYYNYPWTYHMRLGGMNKSNECIAQEVIDGKWGNAPSRRGKLEKAGYNYEEIQKEVNRLLSGSSKTTAGSTKKSTEQIAKEVIAGKWGNGKDRTEKLKSAGYNPSTIQKKVNSLLK